MLPNIQPGVQLLMKTDAQDFLALVLLPFTAAVWAVALKDGVISIL